jgi:hypothetical protein
MEMGSCFYPVCKQNRNILACVTRAGLDTRVPLIRIVVVGNGAFYDAKPCVKLRKLILSVPAAVTTD